MTDAPSLLHELKFWHVLAAAIAVWAVVYLPGLGQPELKGEEGRRILPAVRMLETGDWLVPEMEGRPYVRKPPLVNWAIALSMKLTGRRDEWAARAPSALSVLLLVVVSMACGRGLVAGPGAGPGELNRAALVIGLMTLASAGLIQKGQSAEIEALYISLTGIALALWIHWWRREAKPWLTYTIPWLVLGLGIICKGPPHLVFFYGIVGVTLSRARRLRELLHPAHLAGLVLMGVVALPWYFLCAQRVAAIAPDLAVAQTWWQQLTSRLGFGEFDWSHWLATPFASLLEFAPWVIVVVLGWRRIPALGARIGGRDEALLLGLRTGTLVTAILIWLIPSTRARFVQPLTLPVMLLAAALLVQEIPARWQELWTRVTGVLFALLAATGIVLSFFLATPPATSAPAWTASLAAAGAAAVLVVLWRRLAPRVPAVRVCVSGALLACLFSVINVATVQPALRRLDNCRPVGVRLSAAVPAGETLFILNPGKTPAPLHWRFYLTGPHQVIDKPRQITDQARYLCVEEDALKNNDTMDRLRHQFGFTENVLPLTYNNGRRLLLIRRPAE